jgi:hypothetical protein
MPDLEFQNFSTVQSDKQPKVATIASAAVITPRTFLTRVSGSTPITTITPPVSGQHMLAFIFTVGFANGFNTGGNVAVAITPVTNRPVLLFYDNVTGLYYPMLAAA